MAAEFKNELQKVIKCVRPNMGLFSKAVHLFSFGYPATWNDDNLVFFVKRYNLSNTVGSTGMVDVAGKGGGKKRQVGTKRYTPGLKRFIQLSYESTLTELGHLSELHQSPAHCWCGTCRFHGSKLENSMEMLLQISNFLENKISCWFWCVNIWVGHLNV